MQALIIIAHTGYQDHEYAGTREGLEDVGYRITVGSTRVGTCAGAYGTTAEAAVTLKDVDVSLFEKVAFIGGPGATALASNDDALRIVRDTIAQQKKLGAICIAPTILANAGVLKGKKATVWNEDGQQASVLEAGGATYTGDAVTIDGPIVTANGPPAAEEFGEVLGRL